MPIPRAAGQTVVPLGTATGRPSMVRWTLATFCSLTGRRSPTSPAASSARPHLEPPSGLHRRPDVAGPGLDMVLVFRAEVLEGRAEARRHALAQQAETSAGHVPGDSIQKVEVLHPALPREDAVEDLSEPDRPLAAGRALPARLVAIELHRPPDHRRDAGGVVHDDDRAGAQHRPDRGEP